MFTAEGFACEAMTVIERRIENRLQKVTMHRRWIQATFKLQRSGRTTMNTSSSASSFGQMQPGPGPSMQSSSDQAKDTHLADSTATSAATQAAQQAGLQADRSEQPADEAGSDAAACHEWEGDERLKQGDASWGLGSLFDDESAAQLEQQEVRLAGWGPGPALKVLAAPRELQHCLRHTGLLVWQGSRALAQLILACPSAFSGLPGTACHTPGLGSVVLQ